MNLPNRLRVHDGKLVLEDGGDPTEYLKAWAERNNITNETPVNVVDRDTYQHCLWMVGAA